VRKVNLIFNKNCTTVAKSRNCIFFLLNYCVGSHLYWGGHVVACQLEYENSFAVVFLDPLLLAPISFARELFHHLCSFTSGQNL
jgi:hypothetical protein